MSDHSELDMEKKPAVTHASRRDTQPATKGGGDLLPGVDTPSTPAARGQHVDAETKIAIASQWQLVWWKFRRHKLAMIGGAVTFLFYFVAIFAEFLAPSLPDAYSVPHTYAPPQSLHLLERSESGLRLRPHVQGYIVELDSETLRRTFVFDETTRHAVGFFVRGEPYKLWGLIPMERRLFGPVDQASPMYLFGADRLGRDVLSRVIYGARVSMSIGLVGVAFSLILGIILGGISGYYGGAIDNAIQRTIEFIRSIPAIPLWMGLAAAIPLAWPPLRVYFMITVILSLIGWTGLARVVRGRFFALKTEDFVTAARLDGASELRIIIWHMMPSFLSHIIATITLAIPAMILAETALSFLGIGLRPPVVSWGVLLQQAQNIRVVATAPWLLWPGAAVVIAVLSLNFLGDGLRDAADPYHS